MSDLTLVWGCVELQIFYKYSVSNGYEVLSDEQVALQSFTSGQDRTVEMRIN